MSGSRHPTCRKKQEDTIRTFHNKLYRSPSYFQPPSGNRFFIHGRHICDMGEEGDLGVVTSHPPLPPLPTPHVPTHPLPHPLGLYLPHPPTDYPQISIDFPTMCFFVFGLLMEVEEELIRRIAIVSRRASFRFHDCSVVEVFNLHKKVAFSGGKTTGR